MGGQEQFPLNICKASGLWKALPAVALGIEHDTQESRGGKPRACSAFSPYVLTGSLSFLWCVYSFFFFQQLESY